MAYELKVPHAGESIQEVQIGRWLKQEGQWVERDETVVELETDKASMDLPAPAAGVLTKILKQDGEAAELDETIGLIDEDTKRDDSRAQEVKPGPLPEPQIIMPAAQRLLAEHGLQGRDVPATGPGGRLLKEDVLRFLEEHEQEAKDRTKPADEEEGRSEREAGKEEGESESRKPSPSDRDVRSEQARDRESEEATTRKDRGTSRQEEVVPMSLIRRRIAERLVQAQHEAALLTTFNEIDMSAVIQMRKTYQERFQAKYEIKLGFMSFFAKAAIEALKEFPALNAEVREKEIVYRNYFDIGIAIGAGKGLVVPVLRNAECLSFAEIEQQIADFARRAEVNKLRPDELTGGTFTITNGGVYGSLLSTPIINPPQSGVLGLHTIQERPVAREGQVVIRPMMYVALTYDHRIVDGREAVTFLRQLKEIIEEPARMLLEV